MPSPDCAPRPVRWTIRLGKPVCMWLTAFGFNPLDFLRALPALAGVWRDYRRLKRQNRETGAQQRIRFSIPCLQDRSQTSGNIGGHYFYQDLLVARRIHARQPVRHVDVASRVDGFVAHVAAFRTIEVFDIRPLQVSIPAIVFRQHDLSNPQPEFRDYCDSLSCLHALEHFGLGRYGDPVDIQGHVHGFAALTDILKTGGTLYLGVPIGPERIDFNANRVFAIATILALAGPHFQVEDFSFVDDAGALHEHVPLTPEAVNTQCGCYYGCGVFELRKCR